MSPSPTVAAETTVVAPTPQAVSPAETSTTPEVKSNTLAFTGGDVLPLALAGIFAVLAGTTMVTLRRRRVTAPI